MFSYSYKRDMIHAQWETLGHLGKEKVDPAVIKQCQAKIINLGWLEWGLNDQKMWEKVL